MSVFKAIKGTILSVPKDISSGIKALTTNDDNLHEEADEESSTHPDITHYSHKAVKHNHHVNYDAGAQLLTKFQNNWSKIHKTSEENAKEAKVTDSQIAELHLYLERQKEAVGLFMQEISTLPQLLQDLQTATEQIHTLEGQFEVIESELVKLEDTCERQELHRNIHHHKYQLGAYRQRRNVELEQAKVQMAKDHAAKVQRYEYHLQKSLREKQQAFEASFKEEMQHYKKFGKPSGHFVSPQPSPSKEVDLSEFVPDPDIEALDEFLQVEITDTNPPPDAGNHGADITESEDSESNDLQVTAPLLEPVTEKNQSDNISTSVLDNCDTTQPETETKTVSES